MVKESVTATRRKLVPTSSQGEQKIHHTSIYLSPKDLVRGFTWTHWSYNTVGRAKPDEYLWCICLRLLWPQIILSIRQSAEHTDSCLSPSHYPLPCSQTAITFPCLEQDKSKCKVWGSQLFRQSTNEYGKGFSSMHWPPLPQGSIPATHFYYRLSRPHLYNAAGRIKSMKNSHDTIGHRTYNRAACSAVPQPTAPPRA